MVVGNLHYLYFLGEVLEIVGGYTEPSYTVDARNYYGSDRVTITGNSAEESVIC